MKVTDICVAASESTGLDIQYHDGSDCFAVYVENPDPEDRWVDLEREGGEPVREGATLEEVLAAIRSTVGDGTCC